MRPEATPRLPARPKLAWPFTLLAGPNRVRLVAGEDLRVTLEGPGLETWLPGLLRECDGTKTLDQLVSTERRAEALAVLERLAGERLLVEGCASEGHRPTLHIELFRQDTLDFAGALHASDDFRAAGQPWLWLSTGPQQRGYVSPLFLPDAGPCFGCLLGTFQKLSPAPEFYDDLLRHPGPFAPAPFPAPAARMLDAIVAWKMEQAGQPQPASALYRLHVVECDSLEITTHRVFVDPECQFCGGGRR